MTYKKNDLLPHRRKSNTKCTVVAWFWLIFWWYIL